MPQNVQMVVTGQFKNAEQSREIINHAIRYFKKKGLTLHECTDVPGVSTDKAEKTPMEKTIEQEAENFSRAVEANQ